MFCPECGTRNTDVAAFCEECGAKLQSRRPAVSYTRGMKKPELSPKTKLSVSVGLGALACVIAFLAVGSIVASPDRIAKAYYSSVCAGNYDKAYSYIALPESPLLSKEAYLAVAGNEMGDGALKLERDKKRSTKDKVVYSLVQDGNKLTGWEALLFGSDSPKGGFELIREGRSLLLFGKYRVRLDGMIARDCTISALRGAAVTVDGVALAPIAGDADEDSESERYQIPYLFVGAHGVTVTHPLCEGYSETIQVGSDGRSLNVTRMTLQESVRAALMEQVKAFVPELYDAGLLKNTPFSGLELPLTEDAQARKEMEETYDKWKSSNQTDDGAALFQSIEYKDFKDSSYQTALEPALTYQCRVSWTADYVKLEKGWRDEEWKEAEGSRAWTTALGFVYENGQWLIRSIEAL
jgi:hypothetical protein